MLFLIFKFIFSAESDASPQSPLVKKQKIEDVTNSSGISSPTQLKKSNTDVKTSPKILKIKKRYVKFLLKNVK